MAITKTLWGFHNGQEIYLITITNGYMSMCVTNLGCTIVSIDIPVNTGGFKNIVLGYNTPEEYVADPYYVGCVVGRFANRIANAAFHINGKGYRLAANETGTRNHLHGGKEGFNKKIFSIPAAPPQASNTIQFYYRSTDGEEGYPGNLDVFIDYTLTANNEIIIDYNATTDKTTPVNLTNHTYFNLSGAEKVATHHELFIEADNILAADTHYIPTGAILPVKETRFDFLAWRIIQNAAGIDPKGYNEYFILNNPGKASHVNAALRDSELEITMLIRTTLPGIILYTGDYLNTPFLKNQGICLETQFFPDSPNHSDFPSTLLSPRERYNHQTVYQFLIN